MAFPGRLVAFAPSTDLDVSAMFYVDTLGLTLTERTPFALVVDGGNGVELRITLVQSKADTGYTVLGWQMDDLDAAVEELRSKGVEFSRYPGLDKDEHDAWTGPDGTRIAWFRDPHANVLSLHQVPA
ncbi:VOC family protein [Rhodococcus sp. PvR099]|uniref:VOC family protein n=1 Tax=Rhodococcus sp. PvR099 TaxID=2806602 RepID=UPI001AE901CD|nr:VOC family protein [Rhodococcus sp. PvR099]MBP1162280.1 catechol 2,3-dioxygenase-like lactoylglutathione lyase family enzyme [Rhodococcus sp. PvR099]